MAGKALDGILGQDSVWEGKPWGFLNFAPPPLTSEWTHFFVTKGGSQLTFRTQLERMCSFFVINGGLNDLLDVSSVIGPLGAPSVLIIMCRAQGLKSVSLLLEIHTVLTQALENQILS